MAFDGGLGLAPALDRNPGAIVWRHPKLATEVIVQPSPATSIPEQSLAGLAGNPPFEISGLLLGSLVQKGLYRTLLVNNAVCLFEEGSSHDSRRLEMASFVAAAKQYTAAGRDQVIGYFRSHLRDPFTLADDDLEIMRQCFPAGECISLLIRPSETGSCLARFFLAENGLVQPDTPPRDLPLATTPPPALPKAPTPSPFLVRERPFSSSLIPEPRPASLPARPKYIRLLGLTVVLASVVAAGLYFYVRFQGRRDISNPASTPAPVVVTADNNTVPTLRRAELGLGLQVTRPLPGELDVTWNRSLLASATGGHLGITEGAIHRSLTLDRAQLQQGKLTYFPRNPDVLFKLDVDLPEGRSVTESMRVVGSEVVRASTGSSAASAKAPALAAALKTTVPASASQQIATALANLGTPRPHVAAPMAVTHSVAPQVDSTPSVNTLPAEILSGGLHLPTPTEPPPALVLQPAKSVPPLSVPATVPGAEPVRQPKAALPAPNYTDAQPPAARYIEPKPLRQSMPDLKSILPATVSQPITVEISVRLDKNGKVTDAHSQTSSNLLTNACISAARRWVFVPAKQNGQPVDSTYVITFSFKPPR